MKNQYIKKLIYLLAMLIPTCGIYAQIGIYTEVPTSALDINGNLKVGKVDISISTDNDNLVIDTNGVIKRSILSSSFFRGYLSSDFTTESESKVYKIDTFAEIDQSNNDFDKTNNYFTPAVTGLYNIVMTTSISATESSNNQTINVVLGLADVETNKWVMRFSIPRSFIEAIGLNSSTGLANSFSGAVSLTAGKQYYFGVTQQLALIANSSGSTGSGVGSYFSIDLVKAN